MSMAMVYYIYMCTAPLFMFCWIVLGLFHVYFAKERYLVSNRITKMPCTIYILAGWLAVCVCVEQQQQ